MIYFIILKQNEHGDNKMNSNVVELAKILVFSSVLFVWVVRYKNIVEEFKIYNYPEWLRDLVGIMKLSFVVMLMRADVFFVKFGAIGIMILMLAAIVTHLKVKNPFPKMLPAMVLFSLCSFILFSVSSL
jgi:hypothetical protein